MHLARTLAVSSLVLLSSSTLADVVLAGEGAQIIEFECDVPRWGKDRCGAPNLNIRMGGLKRISVKLSSIPKDMCVFFTVNHAVADKELATSPKICRDTPVTNVWTNPNDEAVDVSMTVKSVSGAFPIRGHYVIDRP
jgi:hypothetical protein